MYESVLIANRGEIAVRIIRTLHELGVVAVAVYSDADRDARHVRLADHAIRLGPAAAAESYLSPARILDAVCVSGAQAVHPGYGFLSERASFAQAVIDAGVAWVGPPPEAIALMGDKIRAKAAMAAAGVAVVPGSGAGGGGGEVGTDSDGQDDGTLAAAAAAVGFPVLVKPSAGGGGKGMHRVDCPELLAAAIATARREAMASFGDGTLLIERWIPRPRHVEVQIFADTHGAVVYLGDRECSLQRRHQKVVEEAPAPGLDAGQRARLGASAVAAARACGYVGAGTVEFIVPADRPDDHYFLEMNTRLQVEHPVTEAVTGIDLVEMQLRVAAGEPLPFAQDQITPVGHAMEARVYAEDPGRGFLPTGGRVLLCRDPTGPGIRVDSSLAEGTVVGADYDPLLAKVVAWGVDREQARRRLVRALAGTTVLGLTTNIGFLQDVLALPEVVAGELDTELVEAVLPALLARADGPHRSAASTAGLLRVLEAEPSGGVLDPWDLPGGWRLGVPSPVVLRLVLGNTEVEVSVTGRASSAVVAVDGVHAVACSVARAGPGELAVTVGGSSETWTWAGTEADRWLGRAGRSWRVRRIGVRDRAVARSGSGGPVTSPMPGVVLAVAVTAGQDVSAGQAVVVVEAMKMEHTVVAPVDGVVREILVRPGQRVALDEALAVVSPRT